MFRFQHHCNNNIAERRRHASSNVAVQWWWLFALLPFSKTLSFHLSVPEVAISRRRHLLALSETKPGRNNKIDDIIRGNNQQNTKLLKVNKKRNASSAANLDAGKSQTWRIYNVEVHPDDLKWDPKEEQEYQSHGRRDDEDASSLDDRKSSFLHPAVIQALVHKYPSLSNCKNIRVVRRSLDARRNKQRQDGKDKGPRFVFVLDVDDGGTKSGLKQVPGKVELLLPTPTEKHSNETGSSTKKEVITNQEFQIAKKLKVIIVGAGPAGLFCALELARQKNVEVVLLERGQPVERRGKDIGALIHRQRLNSNSNFCFGEGGAGTWSDGKLTTRIGRNSQAVQTVLETLVSFGAPPVILIHGAPHLGTDNLVRLLRNMRMSLQEMGVQICFGTQMTNLLLEGNQVIGVQYNTTIMTTQDDSGERTTNVGNTNLYGDVVVLATGHSARDVYAGLPNCVSLEPKGFAVGFRLEHPQRVINQLQYGSEWGPSVHTGKTTTDHLNLQYFGGGGGPSSRRHEKLPVPSYRLATDRAWDGSMHRGVYSFCMCPGGQVVLSSTDPNYVCVNGMSFSRRDSVWANSALVVTVSPNDPILEPYKKTHGALAGVAFQQDMEQRAARMGGGNLTVPVQRVTDFIAGTLSETVPSSSYRLGVRSSPCHEIYPPPLTAALRDALVNHFDSIQMPGYVCEEALLHAVETRTSSPVRIRRDDQSLEAVGVPGLYPAGEGAGFAGGIVSAAVDGLQVAEAIVLNQMLAPHKNDGSLGGGRKPPRREKSSLENFY